MRNSTNTHFVPTSEELRRTLQEKAETIRGVAPPGLGLPEELQGYHTLVPLEPTGTGIDRRKLGNWHSTVYRAIRTSDGAACVLRRVESEFSQLSMRQYACRAIVLTKEQIIG